eukprot:gene18914-biopygen20482
MEQHGRRSWIGCKHRHLRNPCTRPRLLVSGGGDGRDGRTSVGRADARVDGRAGGQADGRSGELRRVAMSAEYQCH